MLKALKKSIAKIQRLQLTIDFLNAFSTFSAEKLLKHGIKHMIIFICIYGIQQGSAKGHYVFSPNSVVTLGVLTVRERQVCLDRCASWACAANSLLFTVHSCLSTSSMCISTAQARRIWGPAAGASSNCALVVVPCAFWYMVVTFRGRCKGNLVLWCSKVNFVTGASERSCSTSKCSFRGRCSTLDMVVIVEELRFRDRCSES